MITRVKIVSAGVGALATVGVLALGVGAAGSAFADPSATPSASSSSAAPSTGSSTGTTPSKDKAEARHHQRDLLRRALHAQITLGGKKGDRVIDVQRGVVEKVSATSITVKSSDGFTATYVVGAKTKVRKDGAASTIGAITTGAEVRVRALQTGSTATATSVAEPKKR